MSWCCCTRTAHVLLIISFAVTVIVCHQWILSVCLPDRSKEVVESDLFMMQTLRTALAEERFTDEKSSKQVTVNSPVKLDSDKVRNFKTLSDNLNTSISPLNKRWQADVVAYENVIRELELTAMVTEVRDTEQLPSSKTDSDLLINNKIIKTSNSTGYKRRGQRLYQPSGRTFSSHLETRHRVPMVTSSVQSLEQRYGKSDFSAEIDSDMDMDTFAKGGVSIDSEVISPKTGEVDEFLPVDGYGNYSLSLRVITSPKRVLNIGSPTPDNLVNVVSMSLYGSEARYVRGAIRNAQFIKQFFPGWQLWIYMEAPDSSHYAPVPSTYVTRLIELGTDIHYIAPQDDFVPPMMWRFLVADDPAVDKFIVRDVDSRLTRRDAAAVAAWIRSKLPFHCIRDHPSHAAYAVSGGLWGGVAPALRRLLRRSWASMMRGVADGYLNDMNFLNSVIWPRVETYSYCTDSVSCDRWARAVPFPISRKGYEHVGQVFDENDVARRSDIKILQHSEENRKCTPRDDQ